MKQRVHKGRWTQDRRDIDEMEPGEVMEFPIEKGIRNTVRNQNSLYWIEGREWKCRREGGLDVVRRVK